MSPNRNTIHKLCIVNGTNNYKTVSGTQPVEDIQQNRVMSDRRDFSWRTVISGFFRSRRRDSRRGTEAEPLYTDWHHPWLFFLATGTMLLSAIDAFFTLQLLGRGAVEINPIMDAIIGQGAVAFAGSKMLLTGTGILTLVFLARWKFFNLIRTGLLLTAFFSVYLCLICYEFVTLLRHM